MQINATFATSATADETMAVNTAINYLDSHFAVGDNVTFDMTFGMSNLPSGVAGQNTTYFDTETYSALYAALYAKDSGPGSTAAQQAAAASLPTTDPTNGAGTFDITKDEARILGLDNSASTADETMVDLSTSLAYTYTSAGGTTGGTIAPNTVDAVGVLEHEITEALGRTAFGGASGKFNGQTQSYTPLDLFRYTTATNTTSIQSPGTAVGSRDEPFVTGYSANNQSYFSLNGKTVELPYDTPAAVASGSDVADWAYPSDGGPTGDSFGAASDGTAGLITPSDMDEMQALGYSMVCFASGTRILTPAGEVEVERLAVGDFVQTSSGQSRPIRWIGNRIVDCRRHPNREDALPVRIAARAIGPNRPARDLYVSPAHAIGLEERGEVLVPAGRLLNSATIQQVDVEQVSYWHIELDSHDLLIAEGLAAESFLDVGNRAFFASEDAASSDAREAARLPVAPFCRPFHEQGPVVESLRRRLNDRAEALGWTATPDRQAELRLVMDGCFVDPIWRGRSAIFTVAARAGEIWIECDAVRPADTDPRSADMRRLGVCVTGISGWSHTGQRTEIPLDDPRLDAGFFEVEGAHRWISGRAYLPRDLFSATGEAFEIAVELAEVALLRWKAPSALPLLDAA